MSPLRQHEKKLRKTVNNGNFLSALLKKVSITVREGGIWGDMTVLTTVIIGTCVSVQGIFVRRLEGGLVTVRVGEELFTGRPVSQLQAA